MCPAIGKVVSRFQLVAPSVKTSVWLRGCLGANREIGEMGCFGEGGTNPLPVGRFFHPSFGEMLLFA